jgi:hypothetical protein
MLMLFTYASYTNQMMQWTLSGINSKRENRDITRNTTGMQYTDSDSVTITGNVISTSPVTTTNRNIFYRNILREGKTTGQMNVPNCDKQKNIVFVKVHKTGSTTAWGIFARFSQVHDLNMVLPKRDGGVHFNYLSSTYQKLNETIIPLPSNVSYNILCNHAIYNKMEFGEIMPQNTTYIGILRNPLSVYKSAFFYFGYYKYAKRLFPNTEDRLLLHKFIEQSSSHFHGNRHISNGMSFDFGMQKSQISNMFYITEYIKELDQDFRLVIIAELFDESLVLMKRYLCWDLTDILYLLVNKGQWRRRSKPYLTEKDIFNIKQSNQADVLLYDFFKTRLKNQIEMEDVTFYREVHHFKNIISTLYQFCANQNIGNKSYRFQKSNWNSEFIINRDFCSRLKMSELSVLRKMIKAAKEKFL